MATLVQHHDEDVLTDACWALSYLSDGTNDRIQAVIEAGVCRRLVELLIHPSTQVQTPALRTVGNIVTGDDRQTQVAFLCPFLNSQLIIACSALQCIGTLLNSPRKAIRKEACWTISNITAGNKEQIQAIIDTGLVPSLIRMMGTEDFDIVKECVWAISNATSCGDVSQIKYIVENGCIPPLIKVLEKGDTRIVTVALEGIENILKAGQHMLDGEGQNPYATMIDLCGGTDRIDALQRHESHKVRVSD